MNFLLIDEILSFLKIRGLSALVSSTLWKGMSPLMSTKAKQPIDHTAAAAAEYSPPINHSGGM